MRKTIILTTIGALALAGCAAQPDQIQATPTSEMPYLNASCAQLASERAQIESNIQQITVAQQKKAGNDAAAMAVGMVLFWPALFVLAAGSDQETQLAAAKGQNEAIYRAQMRKGCGG